MTAFEPTFQGTIGRTVMESEASYTPRPTPPPGAPNIVVVVLDDVGFAQLGCFGSSIDTPHMDRLAAEGLRYANFHTTTLCSPTRACLLTGRNHHSVGMACIAEAANGFPNGRGLVSKRATLLSEVLRPHGYNTFATGKWHLVSAEQQSLAGPFEHWPLGRGFDRFYGFLGAETDQWNPDLVHDNHPVEPPGREGDGYHLSADIVDHAIAQIRDQQSVAPGKPFFSYVAFGACHAPHHAPREHIERYAGRFDAGWDAVRAEWLANQKALGIAPADADLAPRDPVVPAWESLGADARRLYARSMEVFAAYLTHADEHVGRLMAALESLGASDNTLTMLLSDNGASDEGGEHGRVSQLRQFLTLFGLPPHTLEESVARIDDLGGPLAFNHYPTGWAQAGNTPFRWYKRWVHTGGVRDPLIVHWPRRIRDGGAVRRQYHHVTDLVPTILEVVGIEAPEAVNGIPQLPIDGTSLAYTFDEPDAPTRKRSQHYEMFGNRAMWVDGWKAVAAHHPGTVFTSHSFDDDRWELYHLDSDFSELHDLGDDHPERVARLVERWWAEAGRHNVLPLDDRGVIRGQSAPAGRHFTYYQGMAGIHPALAANLRGSHVITAVIDRASSTSDGVLLALGGRFAGWSLFVHGGHLVYEVNYVEVARYVARSAAPLPVGRCEVQLRYQATGFLQGTATLHVDGAPVSEVVVEHFPAITGLEPLDCGRDTLTPVSPSYDSPNAFTGTIERVRVEVLDAPEPDPEVATAVALSQQ